MPKLTVIAIITAKEGFEREIRKGLSDLVAPTLKEKGCINYDLHIDNEDSRIMAFHENWESESDLDNHLQSEHIKAFQDQSDGKIDKVQMHRMTVC